MTFEKILPDKEGCYLNSSLHQCCCRCTSHKPTFYHCSTNMFLRSEIEKITKEPTCICKIQNGWACVGLEDKIYTNWDNHNAGCELFLDRG